MKKLLCAEVLVCRSLNQRKPDKCRAKVQLLGEYDPQKQLIIEDPYYVSNPSLTRNHDFISLKTLLIAPNLEIFAHFL